MMSHINAAEARRISDEVAESGLHSELRDQVYRSIADQAGIGARATSFLVQAKYSSASYAALVEELKKDGYQVVEQFGGVHQISW